MAPVGLRRKDRLAVSYADDPLWLHDRILLAQTGPATWIAASAHWDIYEGDASEWTILLRTGDRGGIGLGYSDRHRVRFKQSEIREELGRALDEAELEAVQLRAAGFVPFCSAPSRTPSARTRAATST